MLDDREFNIFLEECISAYDSWKMHGLLCNIKIEDDTGTWHRIGESLHHTVILKIAKLNDPAKHGKNPNLSLDHFFKDINSSSEIGEAYAEFKGTNKEFISAIKESRNKRVAHPDKGCMISMETIGCFSQGLDAKYFETLKNMISKLKNEPDTDLKFEWPSLIDKDITQFIAKMSSGFHVEGRSDFSIFYGIGISMNQVASRHENPHFDAFYGEHQASFQIPSLKITRGYLPKTAERLVQEWASQNIEGLQENFSRAIRNKPLIPIDPLE